MLVQVVVHESPRAFGLAQTLAVTLHEATAGQTTFWIVAGVAIVGSKMFPAHAPPRVPNAVGTQTTFWPSIEARVFLTHEVVVKLPGKVMLHAELTASQRA